MEATEDGDGFDKGFMEKTKLSDGAPRTKSFFDEASPIGAPDHNGEIPGTLTFSGTVFGIVSSIIGGGIVGLPYSYYSCGVYIAIAVSILAGCQVVAQSVLYLKAREVCPNKPTSLFELGYLTLGRASIFLICLCLWT